MTRRILIVDDSALIRASLRSWIAKNSAWEVCGEAENGQIAVEKVEELHPDVVILDFQMPVMNGLEAAPRARCSVERFEEVVLSIEVCCQLRVGCTSNLIGRQILIPHRLGKVPVVEVQQPAAAQQVGPQLPQDREEIVFAGAVRQQVLQFPLRQAAEPRRATSPRRGRSRDRIPLPGGQAFA